MITKCHGIKERYFKWLLEFIDNGECDSHKELLRYLFDRPFFYTLPTDANREDDGIELRYRFGRENSISDVYICNELDNCSCGYLEMMIALSIRLKEQIVGGPEDENGVSSFFWHMIDNLKLLNQVDRYVDIHEVNDAILRLENREYASNGDGGLFYIPSCSRDMRRIEIWGQAMLYIDYLFADRIKYFLFGDQQ